MNCIKNWAKMMMAGRMTAFKCFISLSRSCSSSASVALQTSINSVLFRRYQSSLSHRNSHTIESENFRIGKLPETTIQLKRTLSSSTTPISEENMSIAFYDEIKDLPNHPEKTLIDVREPDELKHTGVIPTSINIPLAEVSNALNLNNEQFKGKYDRTKPANTSEIIFSCLSGMRASKAAIAAVSVGYDNVKIYKGSWIDWAKHEGLPI